MRQVVLGLTWIRLLEWNVWYGSLYDSTWLYWTERCVTPFVQVCWCYQVMIMWKLCCWNSAVRGPCMDQLYVIELCSIAWPHQWPSAVSTIMTFTKVLKHFMRLKIFHLQLPGRTPKVQEWHIMCICFTAIGLLVKWLTLISLRDATLL